MRVNLCRDRALVTTTTLRVRTSRSDVYVWRERRRVRVLRLRVPQRFDDGSEPYDPDVM